MSVIWAGSSQVNENSLVESLKNGKIAGAAIDVFEEEPPRDSPLALLGNVILSPHTGSLSKDALSRMSMQLAIGIQDVLEGRMPETAVNASEITSI